MAGTISAAGAASRAASASAAAAPSRASAVSTRRFSTARSHWIASSCGGISSTILATSARNAAVTPGTTFAWSAGVREEQADRDEGQRQTNLKPHALRNDAFLLQLAEDEMRADCVFRVAEPPARIAEAHLRDAEPDAELELAVHPQGPPTLDAVRIGGRPAQRFDLRMAVENPIGDAVDPISAFADFAVGHIGEIGPERAADSTENLFRRIERNTADQQ